MASVPDGNPTDDESIGDDEYVLRRVHPDLAKTGKPDRSIFKDDPGGIGTSVTVWRSAEDLAVVFADRPHVGVVAIRAVDLRQAGLGLAFTFEEGNPHHCEAFGPRTKGKQGALRDKVRWVKYPDPFPDEARGDLFELYPANQ